MKKHAFALITSLFFSFQSLYAGGPWLVYNFKAEGVNHLLVLNLGYDNGP
jgi:hypothetical protein